MNIPGPPKLTLLKMVRLQRAKIRRLERENSELRGAVSFAREHIERVPQPQRQPNGIGDANMGMLAAAFQSDDSGDEAIDELEKEFSPGLIERIAEVHLSSSSSFLPESVREARKNAQAEEAKNE